MDRRSRRHGKRHRRHVDHLTPARHTAVDLGLMEGFNSSGCCGQTQCYTQYQPSLIPSLAALADTYAISDHTFSLDQVPSWGAACSWWPPVRSMALPATTRRPTRESARARGGHATHETTPPGRPPPAPTTDSSRALMCAQDRRNGSLPVAAGEECADRRWTASMRPILVTGGTGTLGRLVVRRLREAGYDVACSADAAVRGRRASSS